MSQPQTRMARPRTAARTDKVVVALVIVFVIIAILTAIVAFKVVNELVKGWTLTNLPGAAVPTGIPIGANLPTVTNITPNAPLSETGPTPTPWDGTTRINILVMGLDYDDTEERRLPRTDTMILFTINPADKSAGMLSIPRDLWVNIANGFGYAKINTAYFLGEANSMPGGGPQMAVETVEEFLGVPIDFYAQVDFDAFVKFIDLIQGVKIDVPEEITVDPIGPNNTTVIPAGVSTLNGELALAYARQRHGNSDFDRAARQQQVIMGVVQRILDFNMLPNLIGNAPAIYASLSDGIKTNLSLEQVIQLAWLLPDMDLNNIKKGIISPPDQVEFGTSPDGTQDILIPVPDAIRILRDEIFTTNPISPIALENSDQKALITAEAARVAVRNGSSSTGLATRTAEYLRGQGLNITEEGNADNYYGQTVIVIYSGKPQTLQYLCDLTGVDSARIINKYDPDATVDIVVNLGDDWANSNPMP